MSRAYDDDSGVLALSELPPQFVDPSMTDRPPGAAYWSPTKARSSFPPVQAPPAWSQYGQWSQPPMPAPHYNSQQYQRTDRYPVVRVPTKRRPRWALRFLVVVCFAGGGAYLGRAHLPQIPHNAVEASAAWEALVAKVRSTGVLGEDASSLSPSVPMDAPAINSGRAMRRPEIVPMPSLMPERAHSKATTTAMAPATALPRQRPEAGVIAAHVAARPAQHMPAPASVFLPKVRTPSARPLHVAAAAPAKKEKAVVDPFDDGSARAQEPRAAHTDDARAARAEEARAAKAERAAEKARAFETEAASAREPAPREVPPPAPVREAAPARQRPEPKAAPGSLDDLMASSLKKPARSSRADILDKKLTGINESREEEVASRKRAEAQAPAVHTLTRSEIQDVMHDVQAKVGDCYRQYQQGGPVDLKIGVAESGRVSAVTVGGKFAGTPSGTCVERAVKRAQFPASGGLHFDYRVTLR